MKSQHTQSKQSKERQRKPGGQEQHAATLVSVAPLDFAMLVWTFSLGLTAYRRRIARQR